jgi:uracil-DNA glycosylase
VGTLAILQFMPCERLDTVIGTMIRMTRSGQTFDVVPLPHPSGASPWPYQEPGRTLLPRAMKLIADHPAWRASVLR